MVLAGMLVAMPAAERPVPGEPFNVIIVMGDSNTFGDGGPNKEAEEIVAWRNERAWALAPSGEWVPATYRIPQARPLQGNQEEHDDGKAGVAYWLLRHLCARYPDQHFGVVERCWAGGMGEAFGLGNALGASDGLVDYLLPYRGEFHLVGLVMEGRVGDMDDGEPLAQLAELREIFAADLGIERLPLIRSAWRLNNYAVTNKAVYDLRAPTGLFPDRPDWGQVYGRTSIERATRFAAEAPDTAVVYGHNLRMRDNRHVYVYSRYGQWGLEDYVRRFEHAIVARGWAHAGAEPDTSAPSAPTDLAAVARFDRGISLRWTPADDVAVCGYRVYVDGEPQPYWPTVSGEDHLLSTARPQFDVQDLEPDRAYAITVKAVDYAGNESGLAGPITARTSADPVHPELPLLINLGGEAHGEWVADKDYAHGGGYGMVLSPGGILPEEHRSRIPEQLRPVLGQYRNGMLRYRVDLPDGRYRVTWLVKVPDWNLDDLERGHYRHQDLAPDWSLRSFPEGSDLAAVLQPGTARNDGLSGRGITTVITVTGGSVELSPAGIVHPSHDGQSAYGLMIEAAE